LIKEVNITTFGNIEARM